MVFFVGGEESYGSLCAVGDVSVDNEQAVVAETGGHPIGEVIATFHGEDLGSVLVVERLEPCAKLRVRIHQFLHAIGGIREPSGRTVHRVMGGGQHAILRLIRRFLGAVPPSLSPAWTPTVGVLGRSCRRPWLARWVHPREERHVCTASAAAWTVFAAADGVVLLDRDDDDGER